jgi:hypothetical protein
VCTLRTHQSPGEWQHSLPACLLALAVQDLRPLDSIRGFISSSVPPLPSLSQRDNNVGCLDVSRPWLLTTKGLGVDAGGLV